MISVSIGGLGRGKIKCDGGLGGKIIGDGGSKRRSSHDICRCAWVAIIGTVRKGTKKLTGGFLSKGKPDGHAKSQPLSGF